MRFWEKMHKATEDMEEDIAAVGCGSAIVLAVLLFIVGMFTHWIITLVVICAILALLVVGSFASAWPSDEDKPRK